MFKTVEKRGYKRRKNNAFIFWSIQNYLHTVIELNCAILFFIFFSTSFQQLSTGLLTKSITFVSVKIIKRINFPTLK